MSELEIWLAIAGLTLSTIVTRAGPLLVGTSRRLPAEIDAALRYAPACALAAIVLPDLLYADGRLVIGFENFRLLAAGAALGAFLLTRGTLSTIGAGMCAFWVLRWAFG